MKNKFKYCKYKIIVINHNSMAYKLVLKFNKNLKMKAFYKIKRVNNKIKKVNKKIKRMSK